MKTGIRIPFKAVAWLAAVAVAGCETPSGEPDGGKGLGADPAVVETPEVEGAEKTVRFVRDIKPILEDRCVMCHQRKVLPKRVSFESRELALKGDAAGPVIVPGDAEGSRLVVAISSPDTADRVMPPVSHGISAGEIALIRTWIDEGAEWPVGEAGQLKSDKLPAE